MLNKEMKRIISLKTTNSVVKAFEFVAFMYIPMMAMPPGALATTSGSPKRYKTTINQTKCIALFKTTAKIIARGTLTFGSTTSLPVTRYGELESLAQSIEICSLM